MANWEREVYAVPGEITYCERDTFLSRPFFYNSNRAIWLDDKEIDEVRGITKDTRMLVIACFPDAEARGAIVLVPHSGLWWWAWL